jgi:hypothetical protein
VAVHPVYAYVDGYDLDEVQAQILQALTTFVTAESGLARPRSSMNATWPNPPRRNLVSSGTLLQMSLPNKLHLLSSRGCAHRCLR